MLPALWVQFGSETFRVPHKDALAAGDSSDLCDRDSCDLLRDALGSECGKKQFVIFPAVQAEVEINFPCRPSHRCSRDQGRINFRPDAALLTNVGEVC